MQLYNSPTNFPNSFNARYKAVRFYGAFFLYFLIILFGSIPNARAEVGEFASGVVLHGSAYAVITFLLATGSRHSWGSALLRAFLITVAMGAMDEYVQSYLPYRHASLQDWLVDGIASILMICSLCSWTLLAARRTNRV